MHIIMLVLLFLKLPDVIGPFAPDLFLGKNRHLIGLCWVTILRYHHSFDFTKTFPQIFCVQMFHLQCICRMLIHYNIHFLTLDFS